MESKIFSGVLKKCRRCGEEKDLYWFYKNSDGYCRSYCKGCDSARKTEWDKKNPDKVKKTRRKAMAKFLYGSVVDAEKTRIRRDIEDRLWQRLEQ